MKNIPNWMRGVFAIIIVMGIAMAVETLPGHVWAAITPVQKTSVLRASQPRARCTGTTVQTILSWRRAAAGALYTIERTSGSRGWVTIASNIKQTRYTDKSATAGTTSYRISARSPKTVLSIATMNVTTPHCGTSVSSQARSSAVSTTKPLWGAFVGWRGEDETAFEKQVGAQMQMRAVFVHWGNERDFPMELKPSMGGKPLVIFWEAFDYEVEGAEQPRFSYDAILKGDWDDYFTEFANDAKRYADPVVLIPFEEMNGDWYASSGVKNGNTPAKHIKAYRYVHDFFKDAPNVQFGWAVNNTSVPETVENAIEHYYPGDAYVDIVGVDGFNFDNPWMTFNEIFGEAIVTLRQYKKPIYIFSMASADGPQKAAWIKDALTVQIPRYPEIKGWIWFNENKEQDWRVWSDEAALNAFKAAVSSQ